MAEHKIKLDDAPLNKFHLKITALTFGAHFTDGYALGVIGMALVLIIPQMQLNPMWQGLIGSSALIGLFFGSLLLGGLSDRIGRQKIFLFNFLVITIASFLQFFVNDPASLFILRVLIGLGLGGDYAVGVSLLAEFAPRKYRGILIGSLSVVWTVGYVAANILGYYLQQAGPDSWRWMLASAAIPSLIVLVLRIGTPESPRWLINMGRIEEARRIIRKYIGPNVEVDETVLKTQSNYLTLFSKKLWKRTAFGGLFFTCLVIPYFAIYTFLPTILSSLGFKENFLADMLLNVVLLLGSIGGIWFTEKFSRRGFTIGSFVILTVSLLALSFLPSEYTLLLITSFVVFTFIMSAVCNLTAVYPAELFPTEVRSSGIGMSTAMSRVGAATGTFVLPISVSSLGVASSMLWMTGVLLLGTILSIAWAPETKNLTLTEASNVTSDPQSESREAS